MLSELVVPIRMHEHRVVSLFCCFLRLQVQRKSYLCIMLRRVNAIGARREMDGEVSFFSLFMSTEGEAGGFVSNHRCGEPFIEETKR